MYKAIRNDAEKNKSLMPLKGIENALKKEKDRFCDQFIINYVIIPFFFSNGMLNSDNNFFRSYCLYSDTRNYM